MHARDERHRRRPGAGAALAVVFLAAACLVFALPLLRGFSNWSSGMDWGFITSPYAAARQTVLEYGQLPLWNPYMYGGITAIGYARSAFLSPFFLPVLAFGVYPGIKVEMLLQLLLGAFGMLRLGRQLGMSWAAATLAAVVFCFNSVPWLWLVCGAPQFMTFWLVPWVFQFHRAAAAGTGVLRNKHVVTAALCFLLLYLEGAVYYTAFTALLLIATALAWAVRRRSRTPLLTTAATLVLAGLLGSVKLTPVYETGVKYPRPVGADIQYVTARTMLVDALVGRNQDPAREHFTEAEFARAGTRGKTPWEWWEYGAYMGWVPLAMFLCGFVLLLRRHWDLLAVAVLSMVLAMGHAFPVDLWSLLRRLPVFDQMQFSTRAVVLFVFVSALVIGLTAERCIAILGTRRLGRTGAQALVAVVAVGVFADMAAVHRPILARLFDLPARPLPRQSFVQSRRIVEYGGIVNASYVLVEANAGAVVTQVDVPVPRSVVPAESPAYRGEAFTRSQIAEGAPGAGAHRAHVARFSPNRITVEFDGRGDDVVVLNQNFDDGWRARVDGRERTVVAFKELLSEPLLRSNYAREDFEDVYLRSSIPSKYANGLVAVPVRAGEKRVEFRYSPRSFWWGLGISAAVVVALVAVLVLRPPRRLVLAVFGLLLAAQAYELVRIQRVYGGWQAGLARDHAAALHAPPPAEP